MVELKDKDGNSINCEVLFTFSANNKNFIVFINGEDTLATYYEKRDDTYFITPIENDEDYDLVDAEIERRNLW